jgi:peptide chain release factor 1
MPSSLVQKLEELERRRDALATEAASLSGAGDRRRIVPVLRELGALEKIVGRFRELRQVERRLAEAREIAEGEKDGELLALAREEAGELGSRARVLEEELRVLLTADPEDSRDRVILEVRAGTGGEEASLFAGELLRMYQRYAERKGWKFEVLDARGSDLGGVREAVAAIAGEGVYARLRFESGGHRVQRVPKTEGQGRIHTSAATVAVLPEVEELEVDLREEDLRIDTFCASGPGGQHVNKTASAVRITHVPTGTVVQCQDERSQHKNKARALRILRSRIYESAREQRDNARAEQRRSLAGSGERNERVRTYNFPQDRVTDHRIGFTGHGLPAVLDGSLDPVLDALVEKDREERLARL